MKGMTRMGFLSALFGGSGSGLSNSTTNMKDPLGYDKCMELCREYDAWEGHHLPIKCVLDNLAGPGIEMYVVFKDDSPRPAQNDGYVRKLLQCRGVAFV